VSRGSVTAALDPSIEEPTSGGRPALPSSCPTAATLPSVNGATAVIATGGIEASECPRRSQPLRTRRQLWTASAAIGS
jgi:hypothetical protein